jgi:hypothetical protein
LIRFRGEKMHRFAPISWLVIVLAAPACGLTVTNERPTYEQLEPERQEVVEVILQELSVLNDRVRAHSPLDIEVLLERDNVDVSVEHLIVAANLGAGVIHVSTWDRLTPGQQALIQQWFEQPTLEATEQVYEKLFYRFLAVSQGAKQVMYEELTADYVNTHKSPYTIERHAIRATLSHFKEAGRKKEIWGLLDRICQPMRAAYDPVWGDHFSQQHLKENFHELTDLEAPTGYMYYICRWYELGTRETAGFTADLHWLREP